MTQVVTSYQIECMSGGREILKWIVERSYEGYELKSLVQNPCVFDITGTVEGAPT